MARILITGSSDGLGLMAAQLLARQHHDVVLHARNERRSLDARMSLPEASAVVVGDIATIAGMRQVAEAANATGRFDAVIHNAAVGSSEPRRIVTADGLSHVFAINVLAPYVLTAQVEMPSRLIYLSSGMHRGGSPSLDDLQWADGASLKWLDMTLKDKEMGYFLFIDRRWKPDCRHRAKVITPHGLTFFIAYESFRGSPVFVPVILVFLPDPFHIDLYSGIPV